MVEEDEQPPADPQPDEQPPEEPPAEDNISKAEAAAERLEKANTQMEALIIRQERLAVKATLGGKANAGTPSKSAEQKSIESANKYLVGTGYEGMLEKQKE